MDFERRDSSFATIYSVDYETIVKVVDVEWKSKTEKEKEIPVSWGRM